MYANHRNFNGLVGRVVLAGAFGYNNEHGEDNVGPIVLGVSTSN